MKTWLITGISRGLGRALAEAALTRGDRVVGTVRERGHEPAETERLHVLPFEAADPAAAEAMVGRAFGLVGWIDVLVNNAGYGLLGPIEDARDDDVAKLFEVNVFGPFRVSRAALPRLRAQGSGHIVNMTSIAGRAPMAGSGLYAATKSALEGLSQTLSQELAPLGINVTAVAPGGFRTDFLSERSIQRSEQSSDAYAGSVGAALDRLGSIAGRQVGDPQRAAAAILKLVDAPNPPVHLLLGADALHRARDKIKAVLGEMDRWQALTLSTDHQDRTRT